jgi:hypothetical protein
MNVQPNHFGGSAILIYTPFLGWYWPSIDRLVPSSLFDSRTTLGFDFFDF